MALNPKCPRCGSTQVQLTSNGSKHGCLWLLIFEWWYVIWIFFKWIIGLLLFVYVDWWMMLIRSIQGRGYVPLSKACFSGRRKTYYCRNCSNNFRG